MGYNLTVAGGDQFVMRFFLFEEKDANTLRNAHPADRYSMLKSIAEKDLEFMSAVCQPGLGGGLQIEAGINGMEIVITGIMPEYYDRDTWRKIFGKILNAGKQIFHAKNARMLFRTVTTTDVIVL